MKHCPTCNSTFVDDELGYCTNDGTVLIAGDGSSSSEQATRIFADPPATVRMPPPRTTEYGLGASADRPPTPQPYGWANDAPPAWTPPAPQFPVPAIRRQPQQNMATASLVFGIASITFGWICGGFVLGMLGVILATVALTQIKRDPVQYGGKSTALGGLITGGIVVLVHLALLAIWIVMMVVSAVSR